MTLMYNFKKCREAKGLSQKYVALSLGVKPPSVSDWENGRTSPTLENLVSLALLLGVTSDELLGLTPDSTVAQAGDEKAKIADNSLSREERKLIEDYRNLNRQGQEYIRQTMFMAVPVYVSHDNISNLEHERIG